MFGVLLLGLVTLVTLGAAIGAMALAFVPPSELPSSLAGLAAGVSPSSARVVFATSLFVAVVLARQLARHVRARTLPTPTWILVPLALILMGNQLIVGPLLDSRRNLRPLMVAIERLIPEDEPVLAWHPREGLSGMIAFDLQRPVDALLSKDALLKQVRSEPHRPVLFEPKFVSNMPPGMQTGFRTLYTSPAELQWPYAIGVWDQLPIGGERRDD